jgi:hypothetical protein
MFNLVTVALKLFIVVRVEVLVLDETRQLDALSEILNLNSVLLPQVVA